MKTMILGAFAAISLGAGIAQFAQAATLNGAQTTVHQGPYDTPPIASAAGMSAAATNRLR
jgi:hypothetical protein